MSTSADLAELPRTQVASASSLLVPAQTDIFVLTQRFNPRNTEVRINEVNYGISHLLPPQEGPLAALTVHVQQLERRVRDNNIFIRVQGGEDKIVLPVRIAYYLMTRQPECQPGELVTNGHANVFYVIAADGHIKALSLHASKQGWNIRINAIVYADAHRNAGDYWDKECKIYSASPFGSLPGVGVVV